MGPMFEQAIKAVVPQVIAWRRHLHQYPETSFNEVKTTDFLLQEIKKLGRFHILRPAPTGVVVRLEGAAPGPAIALRADIDALKMSEMTNLDYASRHDGVMHACGHDAHTAMLLGVLSVFSQNRDFLKGTFVFIFQHAEEQPPGGAIELVKANALAGVDAILGQHVSAIVPVGHVGVLAGASSANADCFEIVVGGRGGHASSPDLCIDPIPVSAQIVTAMQQIVTRTVDPLEKAVVSVTRINSGTADNVIPDTVTLGGTVRTYTEGIRKNIYDRICSISANISEAENCSATVAYTWGYPTTLNTPAYVEVIRTTADEFYGDGTAVTIEPSMGGEDFAYYLEKVPGCMMHLGIKNQEKGCIYPGHNTKFQLDEAAFGMGITLMVNGALRFQQLVEKQRE